MFIVLFFSRKDKLYFEDGTQQTQQWCSTCTSSSDDSDYDRWDLDSEAHSESINDRLARSRPLYKSQKSSTSKKQAGLHTKANGELAYSCSKSKMRNFHPASPTLLFYDQHPDFNRPNWLLDHPQPYANSNAPVKKHKKKKRKKCAVQ